MAEVFSPEAADAALHERALAWRREGSELVKQVRRDGFGGALAYVNAVGALAEAANHHPDIDLRWDTVTLRLTTHSEGGLTEKDLALAEEIDRLG
jgi:4a-hydroxytetrahydrobiopterin dehydratase